MRELLRHRGTRFALVIGLAGLLSVGTLADHVPVIPPLFAAGRLVLPVVCAGALVALPVADAQ